MIGLPSSRAADQGRLHRGHARHHVPVDVLDDDDRVVDDQADRQHQRQQRQQVDRIAEQQHHEEGADQRQGHRDHRHDHRTQAAEEQEDDDGDDHQRFDQRLHDLGDRGVDEVGRVVDDLAGDAARQLRPQLGEGLPHPLGDVEDVRLGRHLDADEDRAHAAERDVEVVVLRAEGDGGDVFEADDGVAALLDDQLLEFVDGVQVGARGQRHRHHLALRGAERSQVVVARERLAHVGGGQAVRRELAGIEPGTQREQARAEQLGGLHAFDRIELGLDDARQVVGDVVGRQRVAVEAEVHRVDRRADCDRQHRGLRLRRQLVLHRVDLGVDFGQRPIRVVVEAQRRDDGRDAARARARQVVDPLRLRDRPFERLRDEAGDGLRVGAVVGRRDGDDGVLRLRELVDRQAEQRAQAEHDDEQAHHHGQHRPLDEDVGEVHGRRLTVPAASDSGCWPAARCCRRRPACCSSASPGRW